MAAIYDVLYSFSVQATLSELLVSGLVAGYERSELIEWVLGYYDGTGDNPQLNEENRETVIKYITSKLDHPYKEWWNDYVD